MKSRSARVMVKLASGASPDEVLFFPQERERVAEAAVEVGYSHVSTFIRELCVDVAARAAKREVSSIRQPRAFLAATAEACQLPLGRWLREVTLAAIGCPVAIPPSLQRHRELALEWYTIAGRPVPAPRKVGT